MLSVNQARHPRLALQALVIFTWWVSILLLVYVLPRTEFLASMLAWTAATACYLLLITGRLRIEDHRMIYALGGIAGLSLIGAVPLLSDDYYRYYWDGIVMNMGVNPYLFTPSELMQTGGMAPHEMVYRSMNSPDYYAVYPPIIMGYYTMCAKWADSIYTFIILVRLPYLIAYGLTLLGLAKLLRCIKRPLARLAWIALHPFVLIEGLAQLHIEGLMMAPMVWATYAAYRHRLWQAMAYAGLAVGIKLTAGLLWPFLLSLLGWQRWLKASIGYLLLLLLAYGYLLEGDGSSHYLSSLRLYYASFEFNASLYFIAREIGQWILGYNPIAYVGPALGVLYLLFVLVLWIQTWRYSSVQLVTWSRWMTIIHIVYLLCSTTVHPWYLMPALIFLPLSSMRSIWLWSLLIPLTYLAYQPDGRVEQPLIVISGIYLTVTLALALDIREMYTRRLADPPPH